jgi:CheY-like chemotaxis protein
MAFLKRPWGRSGRAESPQLDRKTPAIIAPEQRFDELKVSSSKVILKGCSWMSISRRSIEPYAHRPCTKRARLSNTPVILCVDDEVPALALRCLVLTSAGYEVLTAADGVGALELFKCIPVDLVITDYWLPGLTGVQIAAEMKWLKPAVPVILFSGVAEAPPGSELADLVITKGMPVEELLSEIGKLILKKRSLL